MECRGGDDEHIAAMMSEQANGRGDIGRCKRWPLGTAAARRKARKPASGDHIKCAVGGRHDGFPVLFGLTRQEMSPWTRAWATDAARGPSTAC
jgi:hypothetical protein